MGGNIAWGGGGGGGAMAGRMGTWGGAMAFRGRSNGRENGNMAFRGKGAMGGMGT